MGFMQSYKRLDNLCRDMNGIGVTGYLQDMEQRPEGRLRVSGWENDYRYLKRCRHLRNRIAHESDVYEEEICSQQDTAWVEDFHQRILDRTDPLALCYAAARRPARPISRRQEQQVPPADHRFARKYAVLLAAGLAVLAVAAAQFVYTAFF